MLATVALAISSCSKHNGIDSPESKQVTVQFMTRAMSNIDTRSVGSEDENAITRVALFGIDESGRVVHTFPVIENPQAAGHTLSIPGTVKSLQVIANPKDEHSLDYGTLAEIENEQINLRNAPASPFVMGGAVAVSDSRLNIEMVRSIAKIEVRGTGGFDVTSVTVLKTPAFGHVFTQEEHPSFSDFTGYSEDNDAIVYVGENHRNTPTELLVKGDYNGIPTAYTVILKQAGEPIHIVRNTAYLTTITPISAQDCIVDVTIPQWNDEQTEGRNMPLFGTYYTIDFHNHTGFTDGQNPLEFVLNEAKRRGLDLIVNSEHGGAGRGNATIGGDNEISVPTWAASGLQPLDFLGTPNGSGNTQQMWRWQSIRDYSFPTIRTFNATNLSTILAVQGLEWNPPGHEHSSSGVITGQFPAVGFGNANAMAEFEFKFDNNDNDRIGDANLGWVKSTASGHDKSLEAAAWLQANHRLTSWLVPAHPERQNKWKIEDYRDMNDVAPDVFVAFESIPGHQASTQRGGYGNRDSYEKTYTFGGVGVQSAKVGNVWDAMLSEGRRFWLVANSDFHKHVSQGDGDFYPGEYQKTYISMQERTAQGFVNGLRAGNIFTVHGDLIDRLEFSVGDATMGQTFNTSRSTVHVRILVNDPQNANINNVYTEQTHPILDHIDLIAGEMRSKVTKADGDEYSKGTYDKVKVIARFDANGGVTDDNGVVSTKWIDLGGGLKLIEYTVNITGDTYFRLRGTNHGLNTPGETDANGNPLVDTPASNVQAAARSAFDDLWFYSNPIFVRVR